jgi:hypothetical protein
VAELGRRALSQRIASTLLVCLTSLVAPGVGAQSGRSWMNGIIFGVSETQGIRGASIELTGDSDAPQLKA